MLPRTAPYRRSILPAVRVGLLVIVQGGLSNEFHRIPQNSTEVPLCTVRVNTLRCSVQPGGPPFASGRHLGLSVHPALPHAGPRL